MFWFDIPDELLPPAYQAIKDMYAYARTLDTELRESLTNMLMIRTNFFIQTCDLETIEYWESLLDIQLYGFETIEERREMILLYLNNRYPTSEPYVRHVLTTLFGEDGYTLSIDEHDPFYLRISMYDSTYDAIKRFVNWFERMCPAHLKWTRNYTERSHATNYISAGTTCHTTSSSACEMTTGTGTLYLGTQSYSVNWLNFS